MTIVHATREGDEVVVRFPIALASGATRFDISRRGKGWFLRPVRPSLAEAFQILASMPSDFFAEPRVDDPPQSRDWNDRL